MELFARLFGGLLLFVCHCFDRLVIHGYLSGLSRPEQVVYFFREVVGGPQRAFRGPGWPDRLSGQGPPSRRPHHAARPVLARAFLPDHLPSRLHAPRNRGGSTRQAQPQDHLAYQITTALIERAG